MNKNTAITLLLIMGFLLIGFVIGFMTNGYWLRQQRQQYRQKQSEMRTEMGYVELMRDALQLSPEQQQQTDSILRLQYRETRQLIRQHRQIMRDYLQQNQTQLQPYLSREQLNALLMLRTYPKTLLHDE